MKVVRSKLGKKLFFFQGQTNFIITGRKLFVYKTTLTLLRYYVTLEAARSWWCLHVNGWAYFKQNKPTAW